MKAENLNVQFSEGMQVAELVIREGKALEPREPVAVAIVGCIDSPLSWLTKRIGTYEPLMSHILVDREKRSIVLKIDENNFYRTVVEGRLDEHPDFNKIGINSGEYLTNFEMADLFKMNRSMFENKNVAMKLVTELQRFKAKVDKEIEQADNNRGDRKLLLAQTVESNLPEKFKLSIPLFKGQKKQTFEVEVYIRASDLCCTLISPEANDFMQEMIDTVIDKQIEGIKEVAPNIVIIEQ